MLKDDLKIRSEK